MNTGSFQISLSYNQILDLVNQLPYKEKVKLGQELAKETKDQRLPRLLKSFRTDELSQEDIDSEVEQVRADIYKEERELCRYK